MVKRENLEKHYQHKFNRILLCCVFSWLHDSSLGMAIPWFSQSNSARLPDSVSQFGQSVRVNNKSLFTSGVTPACDIKYVTADSPPGGQRRDCNGSRIAIGCKSDACQQQNYFFKYFETESICFNSYYFLYDVKMFTLISNAKKHRIERSTYRLNSLLI